MKGHTKIELTDVKTGLVDVKEDDNMVTNALNMILACAGIGNARNGLDTESSIYNYPLWQHYLGGLLLFNQAITENVDNILFPDGNRMIGNGAYGVANSNEVIEMGSWNESESGVQEDGSLKLVWDFSTQQANGTIACACLSSRDGGYIGAGNYSGAYNSSNVHTVNGKSFGGYITNYDVPVTKRVVSNALDMVDDNDNLYLLYADYLENTITYIEPRTINYNTSGDVSKHWYNSGKLNISKYRYGMSAVDLLETCEVLNKISTMEITVPDEVKNYVGSDYTKNYHAVTTIGEDTYIVFYANSSQIAVNEKIIVLKVNNIGETTVYNVTNTTGVSLKTGKRIFYVTTNGYLVAEGYNSPYDFYAINMTDNTDVKKIDNKNQVQISEFSRWNSGNSAYFIQSGITYKIDVELGILLPKNGNATLSSHWAEIPVLNNPLLVITSMKPKNESQQALLYRSMTYLATINNLEEPVVKTASKTMKVTYTITF